MISTTILLYRGSVRVGRSGDRMLVGGEIFRVCPDRPWDPPSHLYNGYRLFPGGKAAEAWRWPPILSSTKVKERVWLYLYYLGAFVVCPWAKLAFFVFKIFLLYRSNCTKYNNVYFILHLQVKTSFFFFAVALRPNAGRNLILEVSRSHTTTHHIR